MRTRASLALLGGVLLLKVSAAMAYEAHTTLAGLTERAALGSQLHRRLVERFHCSLGLFEPLQLHFPQISDPVLARGLRARLLTLDPAEGYAPAGEAWLKASTRTTPRGSARAPEGAGGEFMRQSALGWLAAGSVLEEMPIARSVHHFFYPATGTGLQRPPGQTSTNASVHAFRAGIASARELLTGAAVDGTGMPAPQWLLDPHNELGLASFQRAYREAVLGETPAARQTALVQVLLSTGAMLAVLEQMGDPIHVRGDLERSLIQEGGLYQRWVSQRYGRAGVPAPASAGGMVRHLSDLFHDTAGNGLAQLTAQRAYPAQEGMYAASAAALLPLTGQYAAKAVDLLFRGMLTLRVQTATDGSQRLMVTMAETTAGPGTIVVVGEDRQGRRQKLAEAQVTGEATDEPLAQLPLDRTAFSRGELRRLAVLYTCTDKNGEPLLLSAEMALQKESDPD